MMDMDEEFHKQELKCRKCNAVMEKGWAVGEGWGIFWADAPKYHMLGIAQSGRKGVEALNDKLRVKERYFPAFRCTKCKIVEFKYTKDTTNKEGSSTPSLAETGIHPMS